MKNNNRKIVGLVALIFGIVLIYNPNLMNTLIAAYFIFVGITNILNW